MIEVKSHIIIGPKDRQGRKRKFIPVPTDYYEDFNFGEIVIVKKL